MSNLSTQSEKKFSYYNILTDSDNVVKDIARLLALGVESEEIIDDSGVVVKPAAPIVESCWQVVYPTADRILFPDVEDWNNLLPEEHREITNHKIAQITDTVILKTTTDPKDIEINNSTAMGVNQDLNAKSLEMYLEIYMPPYLCDSDLEDPLKQRAEASYRPVVNDVNGVAGEVTRVAKNYHHLFMRIFDNLNEEGTGPADNIIDSVTRDVLTWNSRSSSWSKLSWYTDFEDKFKSTLIGKEELGAQEGIVRIPVISGLTSESKIKLWANINASRLVLGIMGSPNVDFSDNRYLIGCAYVGQIDSFDFSINDTAGNFGLFTTSSSTPAMGRSEIRTRPPVPAIVNKTGVVTPGTGVLSSGTKLAFQTDLQLFNPGTKYTLAPMEISNIAYDSELENGGPLWGGRYIDEKTIRLHCSFNTTPTSVQYINSLGATVTKLVGVTPSVVLTPTVILNPKDRKKMTMELPLKTLLEALIGTEEAANVLKGAAIQFTSGLSICTMNITYSFSYYTEYTVSASGVVKDKFGNIVSTKLDTTYGKNTANGITDFAMYATYTKDYFQRHFFMFASTEEYMQKELYGKSSYTGEYFADRIKVVHSSEGPRGILSGMITIDTSSLYPFDELIVNKNFEKYIDEPEELYVYLPITAPFCPFANSPNGRHGIGILKEIRYPVPVSDDEIVRFAIEEIKGKYRDLTYATEDFSLLDKSKYGATITWASNNATLIKVEE